MNTHPYITERVLDAIADERLAEADVVRRARAEGARRRRWVPARRRRAGRRAPHTSTA